MRRLRRVRASVPRWRRIFYEDDLPDKWHDYTQANVDFFDELGSPGGAAKVGEGRQGPGSDRQPAAAGIRPLTG